MFSQLTAPLAIALFLSLVGLAMLVTTTVLVRRIPIERVQVLLWAVVTVGATSVLTRVIYFALS